MTILEALESLGVHDGVLRAEEREFLDEQGYLPLSGILTAEEAAAWRRRLEELAEAEGDRAGLEVHQEEGTVRLSNLIDKDPVFEKCITEPRLLAAIRHVLGPRFRLSSLNARAALPGEGLQGLHADWGEGVAAGEYRVCNSIWLLTDFTDENGATRVVPGSHRSGQLPREAMEDPTVDHPGQVQLLGPAGTVVVFNSHLWHGGTLNRSDSRRAALHCYYCHRDEKQQTDQRKWLSPETVRRLSPEARAVVDVEDP